MKQNSSIVLDIVESLEKTPKSKDIWKKLCDFFDDCLKHGKINPALDLDEKLTTEQVQIGYEHKYYPIYRVMIYMKNGDEPMLNHILRESVIYGSIYRFGRPWREKWKYISDSEFDKLENKVNRCYQQTLQHFSFGDCSSYEVYPIESRPFIWLEKTILKKAKQKCALTGEKLVKGSSVYKFRNISEVGRFRYDFFYADAASFEANPEAMENKRKYEQNDYRMRDFAFYWIDYDSAAIRSFWYNIDRFDLEKTLKFLADPISEPTYFKHAYGKFIEGSPLIRRENEIFYHTEDIMEHNGSGYLNIWHALIKCGYLDQIINYLPKLPCYIPYLLLCFDIQEVKDKAEAYLQIDGISAIIDLSLKSYAHKNEKDLERLIRFSLKHPQMIKEIAELLNRYEVHLYNCYAPAIDWYCQAFARFSGAKGAGLLDLLIPYPHLLKPSSLLLENGGGLGKTAYSDTGIFFIRMVIFYTALFNPQDMSRLWASLYNDSDGNVYFGGVDRKVYDKTSQIIKKLSEKGGIEL